MVLFTLLISTRVNNLSSCPMQDKSEGVMRHCAASSKIVIVTNNKLSLILNESKKLRVKVPKMGNLESYKSAILELL